MEILKVINPNPKKAMIKIPTILKTKFISVLYSFPPSDMVKYGFLNL